MLDCRCVRDIIGVVPATGKAQRLQPMPWSKELLPIGIGLDKRMKGGKLLVIIDYLLECMQIAGAEKAFIVIRKGKWDIPAFLGSGSTYGLQLAYLVSEILDGVPFSVDQSYSFLSAKHVLFGFPDILSKPKNGFSTVASKTRQH
jgi:glucose-1-phosphate thymidylyltransferase